MELGWKHLKALPAAQLAIFREYVVLERGRIELNRQDLDSYELEMDEDELKRFIKDMNRGTVLNISIVNGIDLFEIDNRGIFGLGESCRGRA